MRLCTLICSSGVVLALLTSACGKARVLREDDSRGTNSATGGETGGGDGDVGSVTAGDGDLGGDGDSTSNDGGSLQANWQGSPTFYSFVRLTSAQWENSVSAIFEIDDASFVREIGIEFESTYSTRFSNNELNLSVTEPQWEELQRGAEAVAKMVASRSEVVERLGGAATPDVFIKKVGKRAFRRSLNAEEVKLYEELWSRGAQSAEHDSLGSASADGMRVFIEALLQSPHFAYRVQWTEAGARLSGLELAAKLSLLLLQTTPSDELLKEAESGKLDSDEGLFEVASRILDSPDVSWITQGFYFELFGMNRYLTLEKSDELFPEHNAEVNQSLLSADQAFLRQVYSEGGGLRELLLSRVVYVDPLIAPFYELDPPEGGVQEVFLDERPGLLTRLGFLARGASEERSDPVERGFSIVDSLLCAGVSPALVEFDRPEFDPGLSNRENFENYLAPESPVCTSCHRMFLPLGFAFEHFDAMGRYREEEQGQAIDATASYEFSSGTKEFDGATELVQLLAEEAVAHECHSAQLAEYLLTRDLHEEDSSLITEMTEMSLDEDSSTKLLALSVIMSPLFTEAAATESR